MGRKHIRLLAVVALPLAFGLGWVAREFSATLTPSPVTEEGPAEPPPAPQPPPDRPPDLTGEVEQIVMQTGPPGQMVVKLLVRVRRMPAAGTEPTALRLGRVREGDRVWLNVRVPLAPPERGRRPVPLFGRIGLGTLVTAWHQPGQSDSNPPQLDAEYITGESAAR